MWVVEQTDRFKKQVSELRKNYSRIDAALDGIKWVLERDPEAVSVLFDNGDFLGRGLKLDPWPNVPQAYVYFTIIGKKVLLYAIYDTSGGDTTAM